mgnify:CR=1 FL=1
MAKVIKELFRTLGPSAYKEGRLEQLLRKVIAPCQSRNGEPLLGIRTYRLDQQEKVDLLKSLRENELYKEGIKNVPENEREAAQRSIESFVTEISDGFQQLATQLLNLDDATRTQIHEALKGNGDLVIDEDPSSSGSHG